MNAVLVCVFEDVINYFYFTVYYLLICISVFMKYAIIIYVCIYLYFSP